MFNNCHYFSVVFIFCIFSPTIPTSAVSPNTHRKVFEGSAPVYRQGYLLQLQPLQCSLMVNSQTRVNMTVHFGAVLYFKHVPACALHATLHFVSATLECSLGFCHAYPTKKKRVFVMSSGDPPQNWFIICQTIK